MLKLVGWGIRRGGGVGVGVVLGGFEIGSNLPVATTSAYRLYFSPKKVYVGNYVHLSWFINVSYLELCLFPE